jgi:hypothetical protein
VICTKPIDAGERLGPGREPAPPTPAPIAPLEEPLPLDVRPEPGVLGAWLPEDVELELPVPELEYAPEEGVEPELGLVAPPLVEGVPVLDCGPFVRPESSAVGELSVVSVVVTSDKLLVVVKEAPTGVEEVEEPPDEDDAEVDVEAVVVMLTGTGVGVAVEEAVAMG